MKTIIYKVNGTYQTTTKENYNARIMNANKICTWENFESAEKIIDYCIKYCRANKEDFIVV